MGGVDGGILGESVVLSMLWAAKESISQKHTGVFNHFLIIITINIICEVLDLTIDPFWVSMFLPSLFFPLSVASIIKSS